MRQTKLIVALDVDGRDQVEKIVSELSGHVDYYKIGLQLFVGEGPDIVRLVKKHASVFLDLKYHDIPNTVFKAVKQAVSLGVELVDVHTSGGAEMMKAAHRAVQGSDTRLLGVTVLTSLSDQELKEEIGFSRGTNESVVSLAQLAVTSGMHGIVASAKELPVLREKLGPDPLIVTPGIRLPGDSADDQKRIVSPGDAARMGADFVVMGRSVLNAQNRVKTVSRIRKHLKGEGE